MYFFILLYYLKFYKIFIYFCKNGIKLKIRCCLSMGWEINRRNVFCFEKNCKIICFYIVKVNYIEGNLGCIYIIFIEIMEIGNISF